MYVILCNVFSWFSLCMIFWDYGNENVSVKKKLNELKELKNRLYNMFLCVLGWKVYGGIGFL